MTPLPLLYPRLLPLGLSTRHLARLWGYRSHTSVLRMLRGEASAPPEQHAWAEALARWLEEHPAPRVDG